MDTKEQMLKLLRIQELALAASAAQDVVRQAPGRIEEIEARFRDRNTEYVTVKDRHDELTADQRTRELEVQSLQESLAKFNADMMQVKNQREYAAMLKEIDTVKAHIAGHEDVMLKNMEELETLRGDLQSKEDHIKIEREKVEQETAQVNTDVRQAEARIADCSAERAKLERELPRPLVKLVHRLEGGRQGLFLSRVDDHTCQACYVRVRPQVYQEIKLASRIHSCGSCRRLLYYEPTLREEAERAEAGPGAGETDVTEEPAPAGETTDAADAPEQASSPANVEAVDGKPV